MQSVSLSPCCNWHGRMEQHVQPSPGGRERGKRNWSKWARCHRAPEKCVDPEEEWTSCLLWLHRSCLLPSSTGFVFNNAHDFVFLLALHFWPKVMYFSIHECETFHWWWPFPFSCARHWCWHEIVMEQDGLNGNIGAWKKFNKKWMTSLFWQFLHLSGKP